MAGEKSKTKQEARAQRYHNVLAAGASFLLLASVRLPVAHQINL